MDLRIPYELAVRRETVGAHTYELVALEDFESTFATMYRHVDARLGTEARADLAPMFGVIWGSCRAIARRLDAMGETLAGHRVLELACGLALPSMVAARHGAVVTATDQHPHTGTFLARNLQHNGLRGVSYETLDLRTPGPRGRHDLVIASDVLFAAAMAPTVAGAFDALLEPGAVGWLADPGRAWLSECIEALEARGLTVTWDVDEVGEGESYVVVEIRREA